MVKSRTSLEYFHTLRKNTSRGYMSLKALFLVRICVVLCFVLLFVSLNIFPFLFFIFLFNPPQNVVLGVYTVSACP